MGSHSLFCLLGLDFGSEEDFDSLPDRSQNISDQMASTSRGSSLSGKASISNESQPGLLLFYCY